MSTDVSTDLVMKNQRTNRRGGLGDPLVRIGLLALFAIVAEFVLAKKVLDVNMNFLALLTPMWIFVAFKVSGRRDRRTEIAAAVAMVFATAVVLLAYAL